MAVPQPFFGDYVPTRSNNQRSDTSSNPHYYPGADSNNIPITAAPADTFLSNTVAWSHPPTTMPATTMGSTIEVFGRDGSYSSKSPSPSHHRYATRTPSTSSSSNKSSRSRASTSSKSSAPSEPATKRRTRSSITTNATSSSSTNTTTAAASGGNKRDKFLERNRIAASKCRQRKKQWVNGLEEAKNGLETQNSQLQMEYNSLLGEVSRMKNQIMSHATCHDPNIDKWIDNEARRFVQGAPEPTTAPDFQGGGVGYGAFPEAAGAPPFPMDYNGFGEEGK